jgi:hypothetical protein
VKAEVKIPKGWRRVKPGGMTMSHDKFWDYEFKKWWQVPHMFMVQSTVVIRRVRKAQKGKKV